MTEPVQPDARLRDLDEVKTLFIFLVCCILIGPVTHVLLWASVEGSAVTWPRLLNRYLLILVHFLCYTPLFGAAVFLLRTHRLPRTWPVILLGSVSLAVLSSVSAVALLIAFGIKSANDWPQSLVVSTCGGLGVTALVLGIERIYHATVTSRIDAQRRMLERERADRTAIEAQWNSLASRLHPHFLFNTLSSIRELMHRNVAEADTMIQRFSSLIRFSLDSSQNKLVPLDDELETVSQYLQIEKMRLGLRLRYHISAAPECSAFPIPSLSVLTLVENSVKHAIACRRSGGCVEITARRDRDRIRIEVYDDGAGFDELAISPGHGLDLLRQRLRTLYSGELAVLLLPPAQGAVIVTILIPATSHKNISSTNTSEYERRSLLSG